MTMRDLTATAPASWGEPRSRTVTWYDPAIGAGEGLAMAGLDYLQAMIDRVLPPPPISGLVDMALVAAEAGRVEFTCEPDESAYNPIGSVHGGLVCTLLDSVAGCALHSVLPPGPRLHLRGDQGQLPQAGALDQRAAHRDRHAGQGWLPCRVHRRSRHRCIRCRRRDRNQHPLGLRPADLKEPAA